MLALIPLSDANPTRRFPVVTVALIALNVAAFFFVEPGFGTSAEANSYFFENAPVPCQIQDDCPEGPLFIGRDGQVHPVPPQADTTGVEEFIFQIPDRDPPSFLWAIVLSTFLHAGWLHIGGNMLFLWVFGNNIEDFLGPVKYVAFYLLGGIAAALAHIAFNLDSVVPAVGASGAVAAVMGGYILLFPHARVHVLVPIFIIWTVLQMPALAVLGLWFLYQFLIAAQQSAAGANEVAWLAHVGGFVFGLVAIILLGGRPHPRASRVGYP